jgi:hypothetical protein
MEQRNDSHSVSYPSDGHQSCYGIEEASFWFRLRNQVIAHFVQKYLLPGDAFLDLGGGNGFVSKMLQDQLGLKVLMLEPGAQGCQHARERGVREVRQGMLAELESSVAVRHAGLFDVLEHVAEPGLLLNELHSRQQAGDFIFLTVPAYQMLFSEEDVLAGHFIRYNRTTIRKTLSQAGYEIYESVPFFFTLIFPILLFRALPYRLKLYRKAALHEDHTSQSLLARALEMVLKFEIFLLRIGWRFPLGSSLMVVARKK